MKAKHSIMCFLLILIALALPLTACGGVIIDGNHGTNQNLQPNHTISGPDATATFGASEFHLQLTAIATQAAPDCAP